MKLKKACDENLTGEVEEDITPSNPVEEVHQAISNDEHRLIVAEGLNDVQETDPPHNVNHASEVPSNEAEPVVNEIN